MIGSATLGLCTTGGCLTHRDADTVQAVTSLVISTIIIVNAANNDTRQGWITLHAWGTVALSPVQDGSALGIEAAGWTTIGAGVHTVLIDTCPIHWTVVVNHTFRLGALNLWVACPAVWTVTYRSMLLSAAKCFLATGILHKAGICTLFINASFCVRTVRVSATFWLF